MGLRNGKLCVGSGSHDKGAVKPIYGKNKISKYSS